MEVLLRGRQVEIQLYNPAQLKLIDDVINFVT